MNWADGLRALSQLPQNPDDTESIQGLQAAMDTKPLDAPISDFRTLWTGATKIRMAYEEGILRFAHNGTDGSGQKMRNRSPAVN